MQAFPVQAKPVRAKPAQEKPFLGKSLRSGEFGAVYSWTSIAPMRLWMRPNRGVSRGNRGGVRGCCGVGFAYNFLLESKTYILIFWAFPLWEPGDVGMSIFVGLFTGKNPVMLVFMFLNETKAAHLFESCESESVSQICPQNCPQKGLERVSTMQHSFVHMGQNLFRVLVHNTTKPNKTAL